VGQPLNQQQVYSHCPILSSSDFRPATRVHGNQSQDLENNWVWKAEVSVLLEWDWSHQ